MVALTHLCSTAHKIRAIINSGRGICRLVTLCGTITQLVSKNDRRLPGSESDEDDDDDDDNSSNDEETSPEKKEEVKR